ncbi:hypothetical protein K505DRAFT_330698 [Melanomma pulvis-pyrius CBS 109.77]|uniref:RING-type domain-containing protein n=1 Tax=Melanomma pulvis-pyrius CBS 109.77 TaxID=1314802 RepID=A0A6A6WPR8_9PLEO|nr:hypothetical protein K505DRAFT_330698 [Melanomma pulvis-pyrius CBS 109.77]
MSAFDPPSPPSTEPAHAPFTPAAAAPAAPLFNPAFDRPSYNPADCYFNEAIAAYRPSLSPSPPSSFLDNILNPASSCPYQSFGPPAFTSPPRRLPRSPALPYIDFNTPDMPPTHRRPSRLPNGYVDLTHEAEPAPSTTAASRRKRSSVTPGPSAKRAKHSDGSSGSPSTVQEPASPRIEKIDLSGDRVSAADVLHKQRAEAPKAQKRPEEKPTSFNSFTCVICMDTPTDITATSCGHLFCHTCLMEALIAGENRSGPNEPKRSQCPVCRKFLNRNKAADIIPLLMKKGLATQPRKSSLNASKVTS